MGTCPTGAPRSGPARHVFARLASLQYRVASAFVLVSAVVSILLGTALFFAIEDLEQRLIDQSLAAELEDYLSRRARNPHSPPPATAVVRGFVEPSARFAEGIPEGLRNHPPGNYLLALDGRSYRAAVAERGSERFYLLHDLSQADERNQAIIALIASGVIFAILGSVAVGVVMARRLIRPVSRLAAHVSQAQPEMHSPLPDDYLVEDEVGQLAGALARYQQRIQGFVERERSFSAYLSHELRTPLTVIRGANDLLLAESPTGVQGERLSRIRRAVEEMSELIPPLLALARETPATVDNTDAVHEVLRQVENHQELLQGKPVELDLDLPEHLAIAGEPSLLRAVLGNLIRNAFSYTDSGRISIQLNAQGFIIKDTGRGIDRELFDQLFAGPWPSAQGYGIGLSLVKRICERYGWVLSLDSEPDSGTSIHLRFDQ